jgi:hypothetical protein
VAATIDGQEVAGLDDPIGTIYRVQSSEFSYTLPDFNIYDVFGLPTGPITIAPAVSDGIFLLVRPLRPGEHTIHFEGETSTGLTLSITYHLFVTSHPCSAVAPTATRAPAPPCHSGVRGGARLVRRGRDDVPSSRHDGS